MRLFILTAVLCLAAANAQACECTPGASNAAYLINDHAISVADVTVRGYNTHIGQSALQINNIRHGMLTAQNIRARFDGQCAMIPGPANITAAIRAESDGTYSVLDKCATAAILQALGGK